LSDINLHRFARSNGARLIQSRRERKHVEMASDTPQGAAGHDDVLGISAYGAREDVRSF
jgi:hypothetical protein